MGERSGIERGGESDSRQDRLTCGQEREGMSVEEIQLCGTRIRPLRKCLKRETKGEKVERESLVKY